MVEWQGVPIPVDLGQQGGEGGVGGGGGGGGGGGRPVGGEGGCRQGFV